MKQTIIFQPGKVYFVSYTFQTTDSHGFGSLIWEKGDVGSSLLEAQENIAEDSNFRNVVILYYREV